VEDGGGSRPFRLASRTAAGGTGLAPSTAMQQGDGTVVGSDRPDQPITNGGPPRPSASVARRFLTTVLFIDVVDSTRRAVELGDSDWLVLQEAHEAMIRFEVARFAGRCLSTIGDGVVASFASAAAAVRCAASIADNSRALGVEVRSGLHSGDAERRGRRIGGIVFHVGARVMNFAAAGEVLVSRTVTELVSGAGFVFARRGSHRLKGLPGDWPLYSLIGRRTLGTRCTAV